ncbi:hypothetical protein NpNSSI1_00008534 [Neofusicoccum parvum]|nr:hypothetical protein NpNSSI1_00008534 [Neofusicoccum parvum]
MTEAPSSPSGSQAKQQDPSQNAGGSPTSTSVPGGESGEEALVNSGNEASNTDLNASYTISSSDDSNIDASSNDERPSPSQSQEISSTHESEEDNADSEGSTCSSDSSLEDVAAPIPATKLEDLIRQIQNLELVLHVKPENELALPSKELKNLNCLVVLLERVGPWTHEDMKPVLLEQVEYLVRRLGELVALYPKYLGAREERVRRTNSSDKQPQGDWFDEVMMVTRARQAQVLWTMSRIRTIFNGWIYDEELQGRCNNLDDFIEGHEMELRMNARENPKLLPMFKRMSILHPLEQQVASIKKGSKPRPGVDPPVDAQTTYGNAYVDSALANMIGDASPFHPEAYLKIYGIKHSDFGIATTVPGMVHVLNIKGTLSLTPNIVDYFSRVRLLWDADAAIKHFNRLKWKGELFEPRGEKSQCNHYTMHFVLKKLYKIKLRPGLVYPTKEEEDRRLGVGRAKPLIYRYTRD